MKNSVSKIRSGTTLLVAAYWLALFTATHVPKVPAAFSAPGADKWEHLVSYGTLAFLLAGRRSLWQPVIWKVFFKIGMLVALYGIFDELTQPFFGRHADVADWFADVLGCVIGLTAFAIVRAIFVRSVKLPSASLSQNSGSPDESP
jgi:VanZ family protein